MKPGVAQRAEHPPTGHAGAADGGRIALFLPSLAGGGAERIMLTLAAGLSARGVGVDLVLATATGEYMDRIPEGVRLVDLGTTRPLTAVLALARYLRAQHPRALLTTILSANLAAFLAHWLSGAATRLVVRESSTLSADLTRMTPLNRILTPWLIARGFARAHAFVAPSRSAADDLAKTVGIPREAIEVIYNPVMSDSLREHARQPTVHPWLQGGEVPVIVGMGRLTWQKDFATLIRAFDLVRRAMPARLIIMGEGEDRGELEALCHVLGVAEDVDLPGFVDNPYAFLSRAQLFVLSSRWEGLPGALIEALACGAPVVSTDCPSGPREILDNGASGQLVGVGDAQAMATAILRALRRDFVPTHPADWLKRFDVETNTDLYLSLLLGRKAPLIDRAAETKGKIERVRQ